MAGKLVVAVLAGLLSALVGSWNALGMAYAGAREEMVSLPVGNRSLAHATAEARRTLPRFFELAGSGISGQYLVKMSIDQGGTVEHVWICIDDYREGVFHGRLANEPAGPGPYGIWDIVSVAEAEIEDWMINTGEVRYGAYTIRALVKEMPRHRTEGLNLVFRD